MSFVFHSRMQQHFIDILCIALGVFSKQGCAAKFLAK